MNGQGEQLGDGPRAQDGEAAAFVLPSAVAAAHELKSPLSLMRQLSLRLEDETLTPAQRQALVSRITLTSERALRLTQDLTRAARLDQATFALEPVNPEQICRDIAHELAPLFDAHHKTLREPRRTRSLLLVANRDLLRRVIINFADNALYYSAAGSDVRLSVTSVGKGEAVRIGVRDYGPMLSTDVWRVLERRLKTAPQPVQSRPQSSGLGLYLASQFAEFMQGSIGVTRHRDGATFYVELRASRQLSFL